jgi:ubiquinone/menaquinone biosynthesis C-methylase UbiE
MSSPATAVDYDRIAVTYNQRFDENARSGTSEALLEIARQLEDGLRRAPRVLEVGCGTGKWLADLSPVAGAAYGLDLSAGMLRQAQERGAALRLVRGRAGRLPFAAASFDLVYCVNAIHHFARPRAWLAEARRLLRPGGRLAVIGMDPHGRRESWYVYRYFEGVYATDLRRFPSWGAVQTWMGEEGLQDVTRRQVERIWSPKTGRAVLDDPFIRPASCSQLALLSEEAYQAGLCRIEVALARAEQADETLVFPVDVPLALIVGEAPYL